MIEYVIAENPDDRVLRRASELIKKGELVCIPTDTNWVVIADPFSKQGVEKIYKFKNVDKLHHFSLLCDSISRASEVALIDDSIFKILRRITPGHFTFIFEATKKITKAVQANKMDHQVGIRFIPSTLVEKLLAVHGEVVMSTNIDYAKYGLDEDNVYSYQIEEAIGNSLQMIIDPGEYEFAGQSTIVDFTSGAAEIIRQGVGKL
ncbi:L-threonylcarbamoyladenylate synthase [Bacteriovorax sp. Seq25_V]|uniref:L-threonylcarbamoyladenylate synthase n=1 Tax=Bacteriovorax sp. Seq25_V TaxID=1201288 RepID=UPI000389EBF3|nr:L-threonylcarbamoyladenylate synthase [Bacteriovorax sp. Seq25_V]EQC46863.1 tRNA threonylcarbamoyl adenosine modification protein, Sua5/YciO/YrdC/YwlC family [Bacteriovorax sp. Seq25_V]